MNPQVDSDERSSTARGALHEPPGGFVDRNARAREKRSALRAQLEQDPFVSWIHDQELDEFIWFRTNQRDERLGAHPAVELEDLLGREAHLSFRRAQSDRGRPFSGVFRARVSFKQQVRASALILGKVSGEQRGNRYSHGILLPRAPRGVVGSTRKILKDLLRHLPQSAILLGVAGNELFANEAWRVEHGVPLNLLDREGHTPGSPRESRKAWLSEIIECLCDGSCSGVRTIAMGQEQGMFQVHRSVAGIPVACTWISRDRVRSTTRDCESESDHRSLCQAGEASTVFLHEIKNSVLGIKLALGVFKDQMTERSGQIFEELQSSIWRLGSLAQNTLEYVRPLCPARRVFQVKTAVDQVLSQMMISARAKRVGIELVTNTTAHQTLVTDPDLLKLALRNLVDNALDAVDPAGKVRVTIDSKGAEYLIRVDDDGVGVPEPERASIFRPFNTSKAHGTGLGLPIAHKIALSLGGVLILQDSDLGGCQFTLRLPKVYVGGHESERTGSEGHSVVPD